MESLVTDSDLWPAALNLWKRFRTFETRALPTATDVGTDGADKKTVEVAPGRPGKGHHDSAPTDRPTDGGPTLEALKFRASVVRDGRHPFNSVQASPRLGEAVSSVNRGWSVDLKVRRRFCGWRFHTPALL